MRLVQFENEKGAVRVAVVEGPTLREVNDVSSTYELVLEAIQKREPIDKMIEERVGDQRHAYSEVIASNRLLPPILHPDPVRLWVTGTGLTHLGSAAARDSMHNDLGSDAGLTDSMKMFNMGLREGKPAKGNVGVQPEWFYKGNGHTVVAPGAEIHSPSFALLDGDEIEVCGIYVIGEDGTPYRIGYAVGNEFSDHRTEKINYLYLAHSKLRPCSYGPELLVGDLPADVRGTSRIIRNGHVIWEEEFLSGEDNMSHSIANLEHHHFKYDLFRQPGDVHCHFFGTATASFSKGIEPKDGDIFEMEVEGFGAPLRNTLRVDTVKEVSVNKIYRSS